MLFFVMGAVPDYGDSIAYLEGFVNSSTDVDDLDRNISFHTVVYYIFGSM